MKRFWKYLICLTLLALATPAAAQYVRVDCSTLAVSASTRATCFDNTLKRLFYWNGSAWALEDMVPTGAITTSGLTQASGKLLGRSTASTGAIEEITVGTGLSLAGGTLTSSGGGYDTVQDEGSGLTQRTTLNFAGAGVTCADDTTKTTCTITGAAGEIWTNAGPNSIRSAPPTTGWSWDNQSSATVTEPTSYSSNELKIASGVGSGLHIRYRTAPSVPYTITALFHMNGIHGVNFLRFGLVFRQSSDGKIAYGGLRTDSAADAIVSSKYTNSTTFSADYATVAPGTRERFIWLRINDNNTNRIISYSWDGINFIQLHSVVRTDFLTADQVGWFIQSEGGAAIAVNLISWVAS